MIDEAYKQELELLAELLELGGNTTVNVHGIERATLAEWIIDGKIESLARKNLPTAEATYLVGKVKVGRIEFTLFGDSVSS